MKSSYILRGFCNNIKIEQTARTALISRCISQQIGKKRATCVLIILIRLRQKIATRGKATVASFVSEGKHVCATLIKYEIVSSAFLKIKDQTHFPASAPVPLQQIIKMSCSFRLCGVYREEIRSFYLSAASTLRKRKNGRSTLN